jgi:hypothetical protein
VNRFVHSNLGHFLQKPLDVEGSDLPSDYHNQDDSDDDDPDDSEEDEKEDQDNDDDDSDDDSAESESVLTISGEKAEPDENGDDGQPAPSWVKDLRRANREDKKRIRELEERLTKQEPAKVVPVLGKKPSLSDDGIDYDEDEFDKQLTAWYDRKRELEDHEHQKQQSEKKQKEEWDGRLATYATAKTALKFKDFDDAEENAKNALDVTQQGIIIQGADNSALIVYALGKNPKKAAELAAIKDPIKFAFAIAKLETKLKVETKKVAATAPEKVVSSGGRSTSSSDSTLEKLRDEAQRTGNTDKLMAYKRAQKAKKK